MTCKKITRDICKTLTSRPSAGLTHQPSTSHILCIFGFMLAFLVVSNTIQRWRHTEEGCRDSRKLCKCQNLYYPVIMVKNICISYYNSSSVCLFVCSLSPPRSFDGSSPNLVDVCRWTSELPLRGSFSKRSTGHFRFPLYILYMHQPHATCCRV